jgi:6-phosphogluconolactonase
MKATPQAFRTTVLLMAILFIAICSALAAPATHKYLMYAGTYTLGESKSKGIYAYRFDSETGQVTPIGLAAETVNPSFLAISPNHSFLYAVNETGDYKGEKSGAVSAFAIDRKTGKLTFLNQVASRGADPCYVTLDKTGKYVLVANYTGGSIAVFPVLEDGRLGEASAFAQHSGHGPMPMRQAGPHAHSIDLSPDNRFAIVDDLGLDETLVYKFDASNGRLTPNDPPFAKAEASAGPRHLALHPNNKFGYVINEMGDSVSVFSFDAAAGTLQPLQTVSTIPKTFSGRNDDAEIEIDPSGKFLYASNRGHDSIAIFSIDSSTGMLTLVKYVPTKGQSPRNFVIAPGGNFLFAENEKSDTVVEFRMDHKTGDLAPTGKEWDIDQPVCIRFVPVD